MSLVPVLLTLAAASAPWSATPADRSTVTVETIEGRTWWSVRAENASLQGLLEEIARRSGRRLTGAEGLSLSMPVTIELTRRPLDQVLEYVLGASGMGYELRTEALVVRPDDVETLGREQMLDRVSFSWVRATTRYPEHEAAPAARLAQGELAELRGNPSAARDLYVTLIEDYPNAEEVGEAMLRSGRLLQSMGQWSQASVQFRALANRPSAVDHHASARLELARCTIRLGDPQTAVHMLVALDESYPAVDDSEVMTRLLVRAEALNARGRSMEALRVLEGSGAAIDPIARVQAMHIRAVALEGIGLPGDAARAWLLYADELGDTERAEALEQAARLALEADDEVGTLFICRQAREEGLEPRFREYEAEARRRLGFEETPASLTERVVLAEEWIESDRVDRAAEVLEPLFLGRRSLEEDLAARVVVAWARCVEHRSDVDEAIELLASLRSTFETLEARATLDVGAARLLEAHDRFDEAIDAFGGSYGRPTIREERP